MQNFNYVQVSSPAEALVHLAGDGVEIIAGGTDILPLMKDGLSSPRTLVDISQWHEGRKISATNEGLVIGALVSLGEIAAHPVIKERYSALAEGCQVSASPQLRNMSTIGGNLLQATRCWYYRGPYDCWLKGGERCYARAGENELHAVFRTSPSDSACVSAHPSDPATALLALDATIHYQTAAGSAQMPISRFYRLPTEDRRTMIEIPRDAIITSIALPAFEGRSAYRTVMSRASWTFGLASVALSLRTDGSNIIEAKVALGGVAPVPIRVDSVEARIAGHSVGELDADVLAQLLVQDARPLSQNGYKVALLTGIFKETLRALLGS